MNTFYKLIYTLCYNIHLEKANMVSREHEQRVYNDLVKEALWAKNTENMDLGIGTISKNRLKSRDFFEFYL
jgi:hypothetical protein